MDGRISMYVLLVCVWCSLDAGGLLMVVTARPTVSAVILTPEADRKEGGQVDMRCTATNLESDHIVEWRTENPEQTLRWNNKTKITNNRRFVFTTTYSQGGVVIQDFTINKLQNNNYNEYVCNARQYFPNGGSKVLATSSVILSPPSYPIIGPKTVDTGTISKGETDGTISSHDKPQWVAVFVVTVVSIIVIIIGAFKIFKMRRLIIRLTSTEASQIPRAEPNIELQPTEDNEAYLEPTATTTTQDTYYQPVEVENDIPEYDYARPEGTTKTSYEVARQPHSSADRPYQNIDNNNKKRLLGVSPEHDYARPEGSANTSYEAPRTPQSSTERHYQNIGNNNKKIPLGVVVSPDCACFSPINRAK